MVGANKINNISWASKEAYVSYAQHIHCCHNKCNT